MDATLEFVIIILIVVVVLAGMFMIFWLGRGRIRAWFGKWGIEFGVPDREPTTPVNSPVEPDSNTSAGIAIFGVDDHKDESGPVFDSLIRLISNGKRNQNDGEQSTLWLQAMRGHEEIAKATMDITEAVGGLPFDPNDLKTKKIIWQIALKRINIAVNIYRLASDRIFVSFKTPPSKSPDPPRNCNATTGTKAYRRNAKRWSSQKYR